MTAGPALSSGLLLVRAAALYRRRFGALLAVQLVTAGPPTVLVTYLESAGRDAPGAAGLWLLAIVAVVLLGAWEVAASVRIALDGYQDHPVGGRVALAWSLARSPRLIPLLLLPLAALTFAPDLLTWLAGLGLLYVALWAATVAVAEQLGPMAAAARLLGLTEGVRGSVAALVFPVAALAVLPTLAVALVREGVGSLLAGGPGGAGQVIVWDAAASALGALLWLMVFPLWYCFIAAAYVELRRARGEPPPGSP